MTLQFVDRGQIAKTLGCDVTLVLRRANAESWPYTTESTRGGERHLYNLKELPKDIQYMVAKSWTSTPKPKAYLTAADWARTAADYRLSVVAEWHAFEGDVKGAEERRAAFCDAWNAAHPATESVSTRTLRRWLQAYGAAGIDGLMPAYGKAGRDTTIPDDVAATFRSLYLDEGKLTVRACVSLTRKAFRHTEREADFPSNDAFYRFVKTLPKDEVVRFRDGKDAWRNKCAPYIVRSDENIRSNDVWVGDHRRFDVRVRGQNGKMVRPWVTAWFDWGSRTLVGWHVFEGEPCSDTILLAFRRGVEGYGVPHQIYIDNGKDYRSKAITGGRSQAAEEGKYLSLAAQLDMQVQFAQPYNARAKIVERFFLTVKNGLDRLYGSFTGGSTTEKPERLADVTPEKCPTLADFQTAFAGWVAEYHATEHSGLGGQTPAAAFVERLESRRTAPAETLRLCLLKTTQPRVLRRNGVEVLGTWFDAPELHALFGRKVFVRYDPEKMGSVEVYDEEDRFVCTATNRVAIAHGADHETLKAAMREQRARLKRVEEGKKARDELALRVDPIEMLMEAGERALAKPPSPPITGIVSLIQRPKKPTKPVTQHVDPLEQAAFLARVCDFHEERRRQ